MLEEKNDNLSPIENETDGNQENVLNNEIKETAETVSEEVETAPLTSVEEEVVVEISPEELADDSPMTESEHQKALNAIDDSNAEESEDETLKDRHNIPLLDYHAMSMETLVDELEKLSTVEKVMSIKEHVEKLKKNFYRNTIILLMKKGMSF
ncbi:hypothetical protein [Flavobacterium piscinae]|uniref:hypothetical protein n=1 Tax=Flavobacterium piscinae TaxID=2506424 RepID=UPI002AABA7B8|nr:hypothetical protein [Flavobacterium piscinae]